jgi:hypothetical protein
VSNLVDRDVIGFALLGKGDGFMLKSVCNTKTYLKIRKIRKQEICVGQAGGTERRKT